MPVSPVVTPIREVDPSPIETDDEEQTPWLALTIFSRILEFTEDELKSVVEQLRNGNTFRLDKSKKKYTVGKRYSFRMRARRRIQENHKEFWLTNDARREFLKDYDSAAYKTLI